jgi:hypothetical protein
VLFALLVLLLLAVAAVYGRFSWEMVKRDKRDELRNLTVLGASSSQLFLERYSERVAMLADDLRVHGRTDDAAVVRAKLLRYQQADPNVAGIYAFRPDGRLVAATTPAMEQAPPHVSDPVFRQDFAQALARDGPVIGHVRFGARVHDWILPVRIRVTDANGKPVLALSLVVPLARQQAMLSRCLKVRRSVREEHRYKQNQRGRPGPNTVYRRITQRRYDIEWGLDEAAIAYDQKSDGMYPLLTNDRSLSPTQVLEAHKGQPTIEKRFEQIKTVHEIAPVFLKNEGRIEALFTL